MEIINQKQFAETENNAVRRILKTFNLDEKTFIKSAVRTLKGEGLDASVFDSTTDPDKLFELAKDFEKEILFRIQVLRLLSSKEVTNYFFLLLKDCDYGQSFETKKHLQLTMESQQNTLKRQKKGIENVQKSIEDFRQLNADSIRAPANLARDTGQRKQLSLFTLNKPKETFEMAADRKAGKTVKLAPQTPLTLEQEKAKTSLYGYIHDQKALGNIGIDKLTKDYEMPYNRTLFFEHFGVSNRHHKRAESALEELSFVWFFIELFDAKGKSLREQWTPLFSLVGKNKHETLAVRPFVWHYFNCDGKNSPYFELPRDFNKYYPEVARMANKELFGKGSTVRSQVVYRLVIYLFRIWKGKKVYYKELYDEGGATNATHFRKRYLPLAFKIAEMFGRVRVREIRRGKVWEIKNMQVKLDQTKKITA